MSNTETQEHVFTHEAADKILDLSEQLQQAFKNGILNDEKVIEYLKINQAMLDNFRKHHFPVRILRELIELSKINPEWFDCFHVESDC